jgi:hypothetical protein
MSERKKRVRTAPKGADRRKATPNDLISLTRDVFDLFHDERGEAYAETRVNGRQVLKIESRSMHSLLAFMARRSGLAASKATIEHAIAELSGTAKYDRDERHLNVRVAEHEGAIYVDLGDQTALSVKVTPEGWDIDPRPPVVFRRPQAMRALPRPTRGGQLDALRPFVNVADEDGFRLIVAWMVAAFRPGRSFPILVLNGEQGSAKSTVSRVIRALVDPNSAPLRSPPHSEGDLAVASFHSHVVAFDNLSGAQPWFSDALCRLATGGGLSKRTLYTDDDETIINAIRPVIVNGIDDLTGRADFAERSIVLTLAPIPTEKRRDEASFWGDFVAEAPGILGVLLDGVASALRRLSTVRLSELPRMADFAKWIAAAAPALGFEPEELLAAYARNRTRVVDLTLEASPVASALLTLLERHHGRWEGEPANCLSALSALVPESTRTDRAWPRTPKALSSRLRREMPFLRSRGVHADLDAHAGRAGVKRRVWRFVGSQAGGSVPSVLTFPTNGSGTRIVERATPLSQPSTSQRDAGDAGDASHGSFDDDDIERAAIVEEASAVTRRR